MSEAKLTLIGMHNYAINNIFSGVYVPDGADPETLVNTILLEYGECETLYANPVFVEFAITSWFARHRWNLDKMWRVANLEYNPIHNYDRTEETTTNYGKTEKTDYGKVDTVQYGKTDTLSRNTMDTTNYGKTTETANTGKDTVSGNGAITEDKYTGTTTTTHSVAAFNSSGYSPSSQDIEQPNTDHTQKSSTNSETTHGHKITVTDSESDNIKHTGSDTSTAGGSDTDTLSGSDTVTSGGMDTISIRAFGNIGVTTSQHMLLSEIQLAHWNFYFDVATMLASDLLLCTY